MSYNASTPDLTIHPPRSPRIRLGGYAIFPRMLDKGRASLAGKAGEYHFNCPLDQRFTSFAGVKGEEILEQLKLGKSDGEILEWVNENSSTKPSPHEIQQWVAFVETYGPTDFETREYFNGLLGAASKTRDDVRGWFDLLDLEDYVSYGGKA